MYQILSNFVGVVTQKIFEFIVEYENIQPTASGMPSTLSPQPHDEIKRPYFFLSHSQMYRDTHITNLLATVPDCKVYVHVSMCEKVK